MKNLNIKIGGPAGEGIKVTGALLSKAFVKLGYHTFSYSEYPSVIRGGHNTYQLYIGVDRVYSQKKSVDILISLDLDTTKLHQTELHKNSLIIYDPEKFEIINKDFMGNYLAVPLSKLAMDIGGQAIMGNMVSIGCIIGLLSLDSINFIKLIESVFQHKSTNTIEINKKAFLSGINYVKEKFKDKFLKIDEVSDKNNQIIISGNEAVALGAIAGGLKFFASYPMTPSTEVLHYLADKSKQMKILVKHTEDEISAINMALGASYSGARSMVATSGSGLCLMTEGITQAGISEIPIVIINGMRPGPAAGMPTWTGQGDLSFVLSMGHDDFPRVILAPGDAEEAFYLTRQAMEISEQYQLPVIVLTDKYLAENDYSVNKFPKLHINQRFGMVKDKNIILKRYNLKEIIALRSLPGRSGNIYCCNSYEHDENGFSTEDGIIRTKMMTKRMMKLNMLSKNIPTQQIYGQSKHIGIISWGSNKGPILEALKDLPDVSYLHLSWLWPFPAKQVEEYIKTKQKVICIELNQSGQLAKLIRQETGFEVQKYLKFDARPFYPEEIIKKLT